VEGFTKALRLATRMGSRITNVDVWSKSWNEVQKRDRLLGVSLTGQCDAWDNLGLSFDDSQVIDILQTAKNVCRLSADSYHREMGIPAPLLITTVKPSGTIAQLPTVSSGVHRAYAPHY